MNVNNLIATTCTTVCTWKKPGKEHKRIKITQYQSLGILKIITVTKY